MNWTGIGNRIKSALGIKLKPPFEVGERILCVRDGLGWHCKEGETYTVRSYFLGESRVNWFIRVEEIPGSMAFDGWFVRFDEPKHYFDRESF